MVLRIFIRSGHSYSVTIIKWRGHKTELSMDGSHLKLDSWGVAGAQSELRHICMSLKYSSSDKGTETALAHTV